VCNIATWQACASSPPPSPFSHTPMSTELQRMSTKVITLASACATQGRIFFSNTGVLQAGLRELFAQTKGKRCLYKLAEKGEVALVFPKDRRLCHPSQADAGARWLGKSHSCACSPLHAPRRGACVVDHGG